MEPRTQAIIRFIFALLIVGGVATGLIWANCNQKKPNVQQTIKEEKQCPGGPSDVEHGTIQEWRTNEDYPKKGEMVTFEGYVELPNLTYLNGGTYLVNLVQDSSLSGADVVMMIAEGDCENTMKPIPDDYSESDLLIYDNSNQKIKQGDKVRVTGKVKGEGAMFMFLVKRIEKI